MIAALDLLYELDVRLNTVATLKHQSIPSEDRLIALNNAQINYILTHISVNNLYQIGFEGFKKRYEDLQFLIEETHNHPLPLSSTDEVLHRYTASLDELSPTYMFFIEAYVLADKKTCKKVPIFVNGELIKHADVTTLLNSENYKPSFEYRETFCTIANNSISVYTDGTFTVDTINIGYIRYPKEIDVEGYIKTDGSASKNQDSEFPSYLKDALLNLALEDLGLATENKNAVESAQIRQQKQE